MIDSINPLVSIIIPTYNCAKYLSEAIDSAINQTYKNIEIIVVDDGSTDYTGEVLKKYISKVTIYRQPNKGLACARNLGIENAKGKYIAYLDSDDITLPRRIEYQVKCLELYPEVALVFSEFDAFDDYGKKYLSYSKNYYSEIKNRGSVKNILQENKSFDINNESQNKKELNKIDLYLGHVRYNIIWGNFVHPPTVMIRKKACNKAGKLKENITTQEDWEYFFRISKYGKFAYIDMSLILYRIHQGQMSKKENSITNSKSIINIFKELIGQEPIFAISNRKNIKRKLGIFYSEAAYNLIQFGGSKFEAFKYIVLGVVKNPFRIVNIKLFIKIVLNSTFLNKFRLKKA